MVKYFWVGDIKAGLLLILMFFLMLGVIWNASGTMDELAHIPAGFGYVTQLDYRLNPEHPPLLKTASSLLAEIVVRPNFPIDTPYWQNDLNGQWAQGTAFLYESGNDADKIIFWSRIPVMLMAILFGWVLYRFALSRFGWNAAFLSLVFFVFSPTFLGHSTWVTTDLAAAFAFFIGIAGFVRFVENPTWKNSVISGLLFGTAQLLKFSLILLIPVFIILLVSFAIARPRLNFFERIAFLSRMSAKTVVLGLVGFALVWVVYVPHVWNYPQERQLQDATTLLTTYGFRPIVNFDLALIGNRVTRPFGQYLLGILMVNQRAAGGNTAYFLGEVSNRGSHLYFPILYVLKESLPFHILSAVALLIATRRTLRAHFSRLGIKARIDAFRLWVNGHVPEFTFIVFSAFYWAISIQSPLNIGVRHVLPTFPFIYMLVAKEIGKWLESKRSADPQTWYEWLTNAWRLYVVSIPKYVFVSGMLIWLVVGSFIAFPHYLSFYNALAGGTNEGYKIATDSNYDWGQDLKRLVEIVDEYGIDKIAIDYFGAGNPRYYLGDRFEPWWASRQGPPHGWFAISATFRQGAFGETIDGFYRSPEDSYLWLREFEPVVRAGKSIFIYKLP